MILLVAKKCKHCGEFLDHESVAAAAKSGLAGGNRSGLLHESLPTVPASRNLASGASGTTPGAMPLDCPKCGADHVQRLRVLYESGSSTISSTTVGMATAGDGLGIGVAETATRQQTLLAQRCAPRSNPRS